MKISNKLFTIILIILSGIIGYLASHLSSSVLATVFVLTCIFALINSILKDIDDSYNTND